MIYSSEADRIAALRQAEINRQKMILEERQPITPNPADAIRSVANFFNRSVVPPPSPGTARRAPPPPSVAVKPAPRQAPPVAVKPVPRQVSSSSSEQRFEIRPKPPAIRNTRTNQFMPAIRGAAMKQIIFRVPAELNDALRVLARRYDLTSSEVARTLLADSVERELARK